MKVLYHKGNMALLTNYLRQKAGQAVQNVGDIFGVPELGISEKIAGGKTPSRYGNTYASTAPQYTPAPSYRNAQQYSSPIGPQPQNQSGGGGGGAAHQQPAPSQPGVPAPNLDEQRSNEESASQRALQAALGVYDQRKQGIMNKIPYLQQGAQQRIQGLDQGLEQFMGSAGLEEGKRVEGLGQERQGITEQYVGAERQTRQSAKGLARQLRNMFAGSGTLDSTQYRDMNIEQSRDILQSLGDTRREKAGKLTANEREVQSVKDFYAQQRLAEQQRVQLAKEQVQTETEQLVQSTLDDANLSDSQKIEAVEQANMRLEQRMTELSTQEMQLQQQAKKDEADLGVRLAELSNKGQSSTYTAAKQNNAAIEQGAAILEGYKEQFKSDPTAEQAASVFLALGVDEETANSMASFYGKSSLPTTKDPRYQSGAATAMEIGN